MAAHAHDGVAQAVEEQRAVGQAGERVVQRLVRQLVLEPRRRSVMSCICEMKYSHLAVLGAHGGDTDLHPDLVPSRWR